MSIVKHLNMQVACNATCIIDERVCKTLRVKAEVRVILTHLVHHYSHERIPTVDGGGWQSICRGENTLVTTQLKV